MSLESKIEKLTNAVEALSNQIHSLEAMIAIPPSATAAPTRDDLEEAAKEEEKTEQTKKSEKVPAVTHEDLQQLCLKIVRDDRSKKPALKSVLSDFGAKLVADVPEEKLPELKAALEAV